MKKIISILTASIISMSCFAQFADPCSYRTCQFADPCSYRTCDDIYIYDFQKEMERQRDLNSGLYRGVPQSFYD